MQAHTYEKIEAYLTKRLTDSERNAFEKAMSDDPVLKETVVKMQLLRKITERNLTRAKIMSIHAAKTSEWKRAVAPSADAADDISTSTTGTETEMSSFVTALPSDEIAETGQEQEEEDIYEEPTRHNGWLPVLWVVLFLIATIAAAFIYLAKSPVEIRENNSPLAAITQTDSTQQVYMEIYKDGVMALQSGNNLAAITHFDEAINSRKLPKYHTDAARFLESVAYAHQQPNKANKRLNAVTSENTFAYPYTNKDKLQVQCKILWARLMGWND